MAYILLDDNEHTPKQKGYVLLDDAPPMRRGATGAGNAVMGSNPFAKYAQHETNPFAKYVQDDEKNPFAKYVRETPPPMNVNPTDGMSALDRGLAGAGKAMADVGRGAGQWLGLVNRDDVAESRKRDKALMDTTGGKVGNFAGGMAMFAPTALVPGANTVTGAGLLGATMGALQPSVSSGETMANIGVGGVGGAVGQKIAQKVPEWAGAWRQNSADKAAQLMAQNQPRFNVARNGADAGYVIPPADLNPGFTSELFSGLSGKIKTAQTASQRNQGVTNRLAHEALGLPADAPLTVDALNNIRRQAGSAYNAVSGAGTITPGASYAKALDDAVAPFMSQANSFPGRGIPIVVNDIQALKTGAFDSGDAVNVISILRSQADAAYRQGDKIAGKAYKSASSAMEDAIDAHLVGSGAPTGLLDGYRNARQLIAKTYTVEKALNSETGNVNALKLASRLQSGKPITGELRQAAEFASAFPKASQFLKETPKQFSPLDWAVTGGSSIASQNPLPMLGLLARPAMRQMMLSGPVQRAALNPGYTPSVMSRALPGLLDSQAFKSAAMPASVTGGLLGLDYWKQ